MSGWRAGAAAVPFPVLAGTPLAGYVARHGAAVGTLDGLAVTALVLAGGDQRLAIITADVVAVDGALVDEVAAASGLDRAGLLLCASHTHAGPAGIVVRLNPSDPTLLDRDLRAAFVAACVDAIGAAREREEGVELVLGSAETDGLAANRNDPAGPIDPRVTVLGARRSDASWATLAVHFACHPTVLGADNLHVSADFPGAMRRTLTAALGEAGRPPVIAYLNGAAGDVSTRYTRRRQDAAEVERIGSDLATATLRALTQVKPIGEASIRHRRASVELEPRTAAEIQAALAQGPGEARAASDDLPPAERRRIETRAQGAKLLAQLADSDPSFLPQSLDLVAWALGDVALLAIPGELFASLGARIVAASPWNETLVVGYANGHVGYLADLAAHDAGTYEALASLYGPGAGERVVEAAINLLARLAPHGAMSS